MVKLAKDNNGNYRARKRLPRDVQEEYGRLYGPRLEAKFYAPASAKPNVAKQLFTEWLAEVEARIEAIIAERKGEGIPLTRHQARALAGEWYDWFAARHAATDSDWSEVTDEVQSAMRQFVGEKRWEAHDPNELLAHGAKATARNPVSPLSCPSNFGNRARYVSGL
jgi:hypothetical protein